MTQAYTIDGKAIAAKVRSEVAAEVARIKRDYGFHAGAGGGARGRGSGKQGLRAQQG